MFGRLYLGELRKQTSKSAIITLVIIMAVLLLLTAVLFDALNDMIEEALQGDEATFESVYTEESAKQLLEYYRGELDKAVAAKEEAGFDYYRNYDSVYMYESYVAFMEYVIDNELYGVEIASVSNGVLNGGARVTAETFTTTVGSMLILLVVIYAAIVAGGTFADEYKRGTVKMLLIRPVSRNAVTTAKLLSALTHTVAAYTVMFACTAIVGYAVFPAAGAKAVFSFNNSAFSLSASSNVLGTMYATNLVTVLTYAVLAFAAGTLTRNKIFGIIAPIILIEVAGAIISMFGLGRFFITDAADWSKFVGIGTVLYGGSNFFISLAVWAVWVAASVVGTYCSVLKRDAV